MKNTIKALVLIGATLFATTGFARDTISQYPIKDAMHSPAVKKADIGNAIKFYFGQQKHPKVAKKIAKINSNRKTNAFMKSDSVACQWAFLSAVKSLKDQAMKMGADAVINIRSNYRNRITSSNKSYTCGAGAVVAGVALVGEAVRLKS